MAVSIHTVTVYIFKRVEPPQTMPSLKATPKRFTAGERCPICLSRVEIQSAAEIIPCMHIYCVGCIRKWSDVKRNCPLCNANFTSWFRTTDHSSRIVREEKLPPLDRDKPVIPIRSPDEEILRRWRDRQRRSRRVTFNRRPQANVLPRQRSFTRETHEDPDHITERVKQWRASIYDRGLQALPPSSKNTLLQQIEGNHGAKELLLRRIEPWIRRELQAVLGDPDPTIIVHVVTSLFISLHEKKNENFPRQGSQSDFLAPLRRFLHEHTELFWHELRCFAESTLSMVTYDTVVVYRRME